MYKNTFTHYLTKILVDIMFFLGIPCVLTVFWWMQLFTSYLAYNPAYVRLLSIILLLSGAALVYILWQIKKMLATLVGGNPFVEKNITCLRKCAVASFLIALIFLAKEIIVFTIASGLLVIVFGFLGLFCLTLKDLFKQAVAYKQENDWTV